jgi:hypothetical protein
MSRYKIVEVFIEVDGDKVTYWCNCVGYHAAQGRGYGVLLWRLWNF